jgi:hypothetical protein
MREAPIDLQWRIKVMTELNRVSEVEGRVSSSLGQGLTSVLAAADELNAALRDVTVWLRANPCTESGVSSAARGRLHRGPLGQLRSSAVLVVAVEIHAAILGGLISGVVGLRGVLSRRTASTEISPIRRNQASNAHRRHAIVSGDALIDGWLYRLAAIEARLARAQGPSSGCDARAKGGWATHDATFKE